MRRYNTISLSPLICALGIVAFVAAVPFFVSAASPEELPAACPGTLADYNVIEGTEGNDVLEGTDGPDYILGYGGDDVIDGKGGMDCIVAGAGFDTIQNPAGDIYFLDEPPAAEDDDDEADEDEDEDADEPTGRFSAACVTFGNVVPVGRQVTFAAGHFGGEGEVTYRWLGAIVGEGQFQHPTFTTPGPKLITVVATDEDGRIATAGCPVLAQAGLGAPVYSPTPGGVGGAPGEETGMTPGTVTPPAQNGTGTGAPGSDDDAETPEDLIDGEAVDITGQSGTNTGRIVLWVLIALIIISLGVLFWQRYYQDEEEGAAKPVEKKEVKKEEKTETKKEDTNKKDSGDSQGSGSGTVIIPPAK